MVKDATSRPVPAHQSQAGACALARDPPAGILGMGKGSGAILWVSAQAARPRVPIPMCWRGQPHAEGRRSRRARSSPLSSVGSAGRRLPRRAGGAGRSAAHGQTAVAESWSRVPLKAARTAQPLGRRGFAPPNRRLKNGGENPARLIFVPFNTRVITTSGNLPPTQLCARINWKSIITITNNSLLAFIASKAWRNSHRRFPHRHLPSDVCSHRVSPRCKGQRGEERGP